MRRYPKQQQAGEKGRKRGKEAKAGEGLRRPTRSRQAGSPKAARRGFIAISEGSEGGAGAEAVKSRRRAKPTRSRSSQKGPQTKEAS